MGLPLIIDVEKKSLRLEWIDVYDLNVHKFERLVSTGIADETRETGEWKAIQGKGYYSIDATLSGDAYHQETASYPITTKSYSD